MSASDKPKHTVAELEQQIAGLQRQVFIGESMIQELSQALAGAQLAQAQLNAQLKFDSQERNGAR